MRLGLDNPAGIALMQQVAESRSAAEAYALLGFRYLVDPTGALAGVPEDSFDLVMSSDVGEHIPRASLPPFAERSFAALRPGGWAYHQIVITDHLGIYDRSVHPKHYLRYTRQHTTSRRSSPTSSTSTSRSSPNGGNSSKRPASRSSR